jgi:asparagine synthase (glutamine-hydrolysing)
LISVGTQNSHDLKASETAAEMMGLKLKKIVVEPEDMMKEAMKLQKNLKLEPIEIEFMLPFWIVAKNSNSSVLMCGQGADELFGGYARFRNLGNKNNLSREVSELIGRIPERERRITEKFGLTLSCPFLSESVIEAGEEYSQEERIGKLGKEPLRRAAVKIGLPKEIAERKKKAAQYGSGSQKAIRKTMKYKIELQLDFESKDVANSVIIATEPENKGWVETKMEGKSVNAVIKAQNIGSLRETFEDFMACVSVAEKISEQ